MLTVVEEINIELYVYTFKQAIDEFIETTYRYALEAVVEIIIVVNETYWETFDDKGR